MSAADNALGSSAEILAVPLVLRAPARTDLAATIEVPRRSLPLGFMLDEDAPAQ